jgi:hypothetical protein
MPACTSGKEKITMDSIELELKDQVIREYANLQRIKGAADMVAEVEYQERILNVRMKALGLTVEGLGIE